MARAHAKRARKKAVGPTTTFPKDYAQSPSYRYANLENAACLTELQRRRIAFEKMGKARGVRAPVRLKGKLGAVRFRTLLPERLRKTTPYEVYDCRLLLALHDLSAILRKHRIDEVVIFSAWRPPGKRWPADRFARRHPGALALDIMRMRQQPKRNAASVAAQEAVPKAKARWLDITKDFHGRIGDRTCGPSSGPRVRNGKSLALRAIVCAMADAQIFSSILSPNFDAAHFNHLHVEVTPKVKWRILR